MRMTMPTQEFLKGILLSRYSLRALLNCTSGGSSPEVLAAVCGPPSAYILFDNNFKPHEQLAIIRRIYFNKLIH